MRFEHAAIPSGHCWTSSFVRWQGSLADVPSPDLAAAGDTGAALVLRVD